VADREAKYGGAGAICLKLIVKHSSYSRVIQS